MAEPAIGSGTQGEAQKFPVTSQYQDLIRDVLEKNCAGTPLVMDGYDHWFERKGVTSGGEITYKP